MLTIRLQRTGRKNQANFRVVVAEKTASVSKKFLEVLGSYNPHKKELALKNSERLQYWIGKQVRLSPTIHNLFVEKGLLKADKVKAFNIPKKEAEPVEAPAQPAAQPPAQPAVENPAEKSSEEAPQPAESSADSAPESKQE